MVDLDDLKAKALAATDCNLDTAQIVRNNPGNEYECPVCGGEGYVSGVVDYCNIDGLAIGVMFYGIGNEFGADEEYFRAASPAAVLELIKRLETAESERDRLRAELGAKARMSIELGIFERMLDPEWDGEFSAIDSEYMHHVHERLYSVLKENCNLKAELESLRAKNASLKAQIDYPESVLLQEPYCWVWQHANGSPGVGMFSSEQAAKDAWDIIAPNGKAIPLYASPVPAQQPADVTPNTSKPTGEQNQ